MKNHSLIVVVLLVIFVSCKDKTIVRQNDKIIDQGAVDTCSNLLLLDSLLLIDTLNGDFYSCRAEIYFEQGKYSEALFDINNAIMIKGENIQDLLLLSDIYFMLGNVGLARSAIIEAENIDRDDFTVLYAAGKHHFRSGNFELAKGYLNKSIQKHPINPQSYFVLGQMAALEGDTAHAVAYYQNAIQADHEFNPAYLQLAVLYMDRNKNLASQYLQNAISIKEDNPYALFMLGVYYQEEEEYEKAKENYLESYVYDQRNKMTCFNLGYLYLTEFFNFDSAAIWFDRSLEIDPYFKEAKKNYKYSLELIEEGVVIN